MMYQWISDVPAFDMPESKVLQFFDLRTLAVWLRRIPNKVIIQLAARLDLASPAGYEA
jgi:hypothetical protein